MIISEHDRKWAEETVDRVLKKLAVTSRRIGATAPHIAIDGKYDDKFPEERIWSGGIFWWTNGFWPGMLWHLYHVTKDVYYKETAEAIEDIMDEAFLDFDGLHHDVGFMWLTSAAANYRITGSDRARKRGLLAATLLAGRYNPDGGFIRAWNEDKAGWAIIDCMMNINLLYWASEHTGDGRFKSIAIRHADKTREHFVRPDGSVKHVVSFDPKTGYELEDFGGQGYALGSSWSRGQAWALYGFVLSYIHTGEARFLDTAKRVAHYFISNISGDWIPVCDFRAPSEPVIWDTSAGAIAACGLLEIAKSVPEFEAELYLNAGISMLRAMTEKCGDLSLDNEQLLHHGASAYHDSEKRNVSLIYGDYYYLEALLKLDEKNAVLLW